MSPNMVSLHASPGCKQPRHRIQKGTTESKECNSFVNYNQGCGVKINDGLSYGPKFNEVGGGWYALERTKKEIKAWFWSRDDPNVPVEVANRSHHSRGIIQAPIIGENTLIEVLDGMQHSHHPDTIQIDTSKWGIPDVRFVDDECDIPKHFKEHRIVINLTFCGDWAGEFFTYLRSGCPGSCIDYVNFKPEAFKDAYWDIRSIRIFTLPHDVEYTQTGPFARADTEEKKA
ncbi:hypothetical protein FRC19_009292 [Serendipita sp. 401]|nr:hypothetical protein FRC19_009292 [Serendipita sp. 401]